MTPMRFRPMAPDQRVFERAVAILEQQSAVPRSPGCIDDDGRILLCAGAALVSAGIEAAHSGRAREAFEQDIVSGGGELGFYRAIDELGWRGWIVSGAIRPNDACVDDERKPRMLARLRTLAEEVCGRLSASAQPPRAIRSG